MGTYRHVLLAMDYSEDCLLVGQRARDIAERNGAKLTLLHVVEEVHISAGYELLPLLPELPDESMMKEARQALERLAEKLGVADAERRAVSAVSTKEGIINTAKEIGADLIVVGSHGRHGLALLLGSTANAVLHAAPCDVLAVRIPPH
ncbi:MAG TPA: universal stress protein [Candidatus Competibacteraceae bacterium]|nr:universal stress protein [Candidatus Competibacteraceae bacterium]